MQRQPIVTVLGHVDHGKTSLLDAIRKTSVASREAGGITQGIGSSVVTTSSGKKITFIDTPGHAAFTKMRSRGAKVADIAILVIAADDGIKPQTKEAIEIIKSSNVPFIVAVTKVDINGVTPEMARGQLEAEGILFEGRGGETPFIAVSSKTGQGIEELLEMISLLSEVHDFSGDPSSPLEAVVIESFKDKRGVVANVVIRNGSLKVGEQVFSEGIEGKVRALFNDKGESVKEVNPGEPVQIIGFSLEPSVGSTITKEKTTEAKIESPRRVLGDARRLLEDELPIIVKAANAGALEAIIASLPAKVVVVDSGIGDVNESDVLTAKVGNAYIFAFEAKIPASVIKLAEAEKIRLKRFEIIYELIQEVEEILKGGKVEILGRAQILASFPFNNKKVAGSKVLEGKITKGDTLILVRQDKEIGKARAHSIRKGKQEVGVVGQGEEFGVIIEPQLDFNVNDVLVSTR